MKRIIPLLLTMAMMLSLAVFAFASTVDRDNGSIEALSDKVNFSEYGARSSDDIVIVISNDEFAVAKEDVSENNEEYQSFMRNGGIIVVESYECASNSLNEALLVPFDIVENNNLVDEGARELTPNRPVTISPNEVNVASVYYYYLDKLSVHGIFAEDVDVSEYDMLIDEVIAEIRTKQNSLEIQMNDLEMQPPAKAPANFNTVYIGEYAQTYTYKPKMKFFVDFDIFCVNDYVDNKDYYSAIAHVYGNSGRAMTDMEYSGYESKYECEWLEVTVEPLTTSLTRQEYGPTRTIGSSSYGFNVGGSFSKDVSVDASFSGSYNISDTKINVLSSSSKTIWTVDYSGNAQCQTNDFHPAITMSCPKARSNVQIYFKMEYQVDSWNTSPETRTLSRTVTCYPTYIN